MGIEYDPSPALQQYAHPERLVTSSWLGAKLGGKGLSVVESDSDSILYNIGHLPTAIRIDLHDDLGDPVRRDFLDGAAFARLMDAKGITRDDTVVIYGDKSNLWASYTFWVFDLFGHPDVRLLDGGRDAWMQEERETSYDAPPGTTSGYPVVPRDDGTHRIFVNEILTDQRDVHDLSLLDLRDPPEFDAGHIPGAVNIDLASTFHPNGRFRARTELDETFATLTEDTPVATYCQTGERAAHLWFVLHHLLGRDDVRCYDGSWSEWGNMVRMPVEASPAAPSTP
ncbi:sulfurtransferase [Corynebacterium terpenotabidum]|uniref:Sulfurtransferase n=1 Tax=Corynebacterium terpenotabidum Y-11 TaxID=1200352 RepID=S4XFU2_9CORY|nr:sulfurtransferase [Corynebacterium terpenotabidum]AGP31421.1 thiosulfate sulfurtransferase [Corynebacterium terpenotabidum Y-11]